jgi:hypothetical protein
MGYFEIWSFPRINYRASVVHNIYKNDLSLKINSMSKPVLFADDTSVTSTNFEDSCAVSNLVLSHIIKWFAATKLVLNLDKTNIMKFITRIYHFLHYILVIKKSI